MAIESNPYETPEGEEFLEFKPKLEQWSIPRLLALFFLPGIALALCLLAAKNRDEIILYVGLGIVALSVIGVSVLSAYIHTARQDASIKTWILFTIIYLISQTLSLGLCFSIITLLIGRI